MEIYLVEPVPTVRPPAQRAGSPDSAQYPGGSTISCRFCLAPALARGQWCGEGLAAADVAYLMCTSLQVDALPHEDALLKHYHAELCAHLEERRASEGKSGDDAPPPRYSYEEFQEDYRVAFLDYARCGRASPPLAKHGTRKGADALFFLFLFFPSFSWASATAARGRKSPEGACFTRVSSYGSRPRERLRFNPSTPSLAEQVRRRDAVEGHDPGEDVREHAEGARCVHGPWARSTLRAARAGGNALS